MKYLLAGFDEFMSGNGVWIVIGVLIAALIISIIFLILNIIKMKKNNRREKSVKDNDEKNNEVSEEIPSSKEDKDVVKVEEEKKDISVEEKTKKTKSEKSMSKIQKTGKTKNKQLESDKTNEKNETTKLEKIEKSNVTYGVTYDKTNKEWVVKKTGASRASKRFSTKAEALEYAEKISENNNANLRVHKKNGKFQKQ